MKNIREFRRLKSTSLAVGILELSMYSIFAGLPIIFPTAEPIALLRHLFHLDVLH